MASTSVADLIQRCLTDPDAILDTAPFFEPTFQGKAAVLQDLLVIFRTPTEIEEGQSKVKSTQHIAGVLLYDLIRNKAWWQESATDE